MLTHWWVKVDPGASAGPPVGRAASLGLLQASEVPKLALDQFLPHWLQELGCPEACVDLWWVGPVLTRPKAGSALLVGGLGPAITGYGAVAVLGLVYALWLVQLVSESRAGLLVAGARPQGTLEVVPVHWWAELGAGLGPVLGNILSRGGCGLRFFFFLRSLSAGGGQGRLCACPVICFA